LSENQDDAIQFTFDKNHSSIEDIRRLLSCLMPLKT